MIGFRLAVARALCAVLALPAMCPAGSLSVMTFNVRFDRGDSSAGVNSWYDPATPTAARRLKAMSVIKTSSPDLLGIQEARLHQIEDLSGGNIAGEGLLDYDNYSVDRGNGEYTPIFYRRDRFTRIDEGAFWISQTPDVPGSTYPGAGNPRVAVWLILDDSVTGQQYFVINTHLDNVSAAARNLGGELLQSKIQELSNGLPILVMGDFNDRENSFALLTLTAPTDPAAVALQDSYRQVHPIRQAEEATFHSFNGGIYGSRIDFILGSDEFISESASIIRTSYDGRYPSDHFPVLITYQVASVPEPATLGIAGFGFTLAALYAWRKKPRRT